ncbi:MAG: hypothetical protein RLZZ568_90 [Cyanobacteriota bacterium]
MMNSQPLLEKGTIFHSKAAFNHALQQWYQETAEKTIGNHEYNQSSWLFVELGGYKFHLNSDSKREGIAEYLKLVEEYPDDLPWQIVANNRGKINKVTFGNEKRKIAGFYFYLAKPLEQVTSL